MKHIFVISLLTVASAMMSSGRRNVYGRENLSEGVSSMFRDDASRSPDDGSALLRMEHEWNEALKARDVAWFERNLASDVTDISSGNGALHTKTEDIEALK